MRTRFAPSPTGQLHLGSAATAIFCAARALAAGGALVLRIEDLDRDRLVRGAREAMMDDLHWLGVTWQEGPDVGGPCAPYDQSARTALYEAALDLLAHGGHTYYCDCSRAEIARVASAPHPGDEGPRYPGTCRAFGMRRRTFRRSPAVRLAIPAGDRACVRVVDITRGAFVENVAATTGDFVLRRGDGTFAYQLAVVADDLAMAITEVVRGADLASSAARQVLLAQLLGGAAPTFFHVPLVVGDGGERLAKRGQGITIESQRALAADPRALVRRIARAYGQRIDPDGDPIEALARALDVAALPVEVPVSGLLGE